MMELSPAYVAGLFDGEGSLSFHVGKTTDGRNTSSAHIRLANSNRQVLELVKQQFGGVIHTYQPRYPGARLNHVLVLHGKPLAGRFLNMIMPFLIVKRNVAWIVWCFLEHRAVGRGNRKKTGQHFNKLSLEELEVRAAVREMVMKINGRKSKRPIAPLITAGF
jgi:hypothetical protein